jgi:hypothetical protein
MKKDTKASPRRQEKKGSPASRESPLSNQKKPVPRQLNTNPELHDAPRSDDDRESFRT